jgi:hypothetical protein
MVNPYEDYYLNQAGNGLAGFEGDRYQKGSGFFSSLWKFIAPGAKLLGKRFLGHAADFGSDILKGEDFKESAKKRLKLAGKDVLNEAVERARSFAQKGSGRKRRRRTKRSKLTVSKKKTTKSKKKKKTANSKKRSFRKKRATSKHFKHLLS